MAAPDGGSQIAGTARDQLIRRDDAEGVRTEERGAARDAMADALTEMIRTDISKMYFSHWEPQGVCERRLCINL